MRVAEVSQGSTEWLWCRNGRITGSRISDVTATLKRGGYAAARRDYIMEIMAERLTGRAENHYVSPEMAFGSENEPIARTEYEMLTGSVVELAGFIFHPRYDFTGSSPDGLIDDDGMLEIKVPKTVTHLNWMRAGEVPEEHLGQCYWNMACAERDWLDFMSHDPRLPKKVQTFIVRLYRDDAKIAEIEREVLKFHAEVDYEIAQLGVESMLPPIESFCEKRTVRIGAVDVPQDIAQMLDAHEMIP